MRFGLRHIEDGSLLRVETRQHATDAPYGPRSHDQFSTDASHPIFETNDPGEVVDILFGRIGSYWVSERAQGGLLPWRLDLNMTEYMAVADINSAVAGVDDPDVVALDDVKNLKLVRFEYAGLPESMWLDDISNFSGKTIGWNPANVEENDDGTS